MVELQEEFMDVVNRMIQQGVNLPKEFELHYVILEYKV